MNEFDTFVEAFEAAGGDRKVLHRKDTAHLFALGSKIASMNGIDGLIVEADEMPTGIRAKVTLKEGTTLSNPVHLCFGIIHREGIQQILMDVKFEKNSSAHFIAHCIFPKAEKVRHIMDATIEICEGATMRYSETHYHGPFGGIEVVPKAAAKVRKNGRYSADFTLTTGKVGSLGIDYTVEAEENAVVELTARVFGHGTDTVNIRDKVLLLGDNARGMIKTRVALEDDSTAEVTGITEGRAAGSRGHIDCIEIVKDRAVGKAIPIVKVTNPLAKVTHEAAIGSVDKRQLETLMAHGLSPEEAVDVIVKGLLK